MNSQLALIPALYFAYLYALGEPLPVWEVCGAIAGLYLVWTVGREALERRGLGTHRQRLDRLEEFAEGLEDPLLDGRGFYGDGRASVSGRLDGRPLRVWLATEFPKRLALSMRADHSLAVFDATPGSLAGRWLHAPWEVRGRDGAHLGTEVQRADLRRALRSLFALGIRRVVLSEDGQLLAEKRFADADLEGQRLEEMCQALCSIAALCERRQLTIPDLGLSFAWRGGGGDVRCPYCHASFASEDLDLTRCLRCRTVHHVVCFAEASGCTLLGCGGERADRAPREHRLKPRAA